MNFPNWIDPTPQTRAFIAGFAGLPVREPFFHQRKQLKTGVPFKRAAQISNAARKQALLDELKATGETLEQRNKRKQREWRRAQRERYWKEMGDKGRETQKRRAAEEMAAMREKPHERKARQKLESQQRIRAAKNAGKPPYSPKGNAARLRALA